MLEGSNLAKSRWVNEYFFFLFILDFLFEEAPESFDNVLVEKLCCLHLIDLFKESILNFFDVFFLQEAEKEGSLHLILLRKLIDLHFWGLSTWFQEDSFWVSEKGLIENELEIQKVFLFRFMLLIESGGFNLSYFHENVLVLIGNGTFLHFAVWKRLYSSF